MHLHEILADAAPAAPHHLALLLARWDPRSQFHKRELPLRSGNHVQALNELMWLA